MTNISKQKIDSEDYTIAYNALVQLISKLKGSSALCLIDELLTESEKIMIVKRFAAIYLFENQYSPYRVCRVLSVSLSTAQRIQEQYDQGQFDSIVKKIGKKEQSTFFALINDLIVAQASPKARARLLNRAL